MRLITPEETSTKSEPQELSLFLSLYRWIEYLKSIYIFATPEEEISGFLLLNEDLLQILTEAPNYIYEIFGRVPIYLELHRDPEEGWDELFIVIKTILPAEEAVKRERELFDSWFSQIIHKVDNRLNYTEEPL